MSNFYYHLSIEYLKILRNKFPLQSAKNMTIIPYSIKEEHFVLKSILHYDKHYYKLAHIK